MKQIKYIIAFLFFASIVSCDSFLDTIPKGKVIPEFTEDFEGMVMDPVNHSTTYPLANISSDSFDYSEGRLDGVMGMSDGKAYFWMPEFYTETQDDSGWNSPYKIIYTMNVVIANVMDSKEGSIDEKNRIMGEAKMFRAFNHWIILSQYAGVYNKETADKDMGIPIMLEANLEAKPARASMAESFKAIIDDIDSVDPNWLPVNAEAGNNYRLTRKSYHGLRARVLFYMCEYEEAAKEADLALKLNNNLEDYNTYSFANPAFPMMGVTNRTDFINSPEIILFASTGFGTLSMMYKINDHLAALYGDDTDLRYKFDFSDKERNGDPIIDENRNANKDFTAHIGVPEMMLIKAEALARKGDAKAMDYVNDLRKKRIDADSYEPLTATGKDALLKIVTEERERELPYHGLRWMDMKRLGVEGIYTTTITRSNSTVTRKLEPNSPLFAFPIPHKVLAYNDNIVQNPRE